MTESGPQPAAPTAQTPRRRAGRASVPPLDMPTASTVPGASTAPAPVSPPPAAPPVTPAPAEVVAQEAPEPETTPRVAAEPARTDRHAAVAAFVADWQPEDAAITSARLRAQEVGAPAVDEATGATLRVLAAMSGARHAVELGTGAGVSTMWLLRGLRADAVLTSIDSEPEHQRLARLSLAEAGVPSGRVRLIAGRALEVLPRLSDGGYDLVLCDAASPEAIDYLPAALRLLREGGVLVLVRALADGRVADPTARDAETLAAREVARAVRDEPRFVPALLPVGAGLLVAVKQDAPTASC